jgi:GTP-binding protein
MGELRTRPTGTIVADRTGATTAYAIRELQERMSFFVGPGVDVYEGMIVGENPRPGDMDVNICREKKLTNMRASSADATVTLTPPRLLSLEQALEYIASDECVEVTPTTVRLRKVVLDGTTRARQAKRDRQPRD